MNYFKSALAGFSMSFIRTSIFTTHRGHGGEFYKLKDCWDNKLNFPESFPISNIYCIPTATLGAAYHDYFGRDLAQKFNNYFKTDVSPYILDGVVFGSLVFAAEKTMGTTFHLSLTEGFVFGCTAALGGYFGD